MKIPTKATRIICPAPCRVELESIDMPLPAEGEVLIETAYSVLSPGTERAWLSGEQNTAQVFPTYPGYSAAGRVLAVGAGVGDLRIGDRVVAYHLNHASHGVICRSKVYRIEDDLLPLSEAAFVVLAAMSLQAVRKARLELAESVAVMGLGILGQFAVQLARAQGGLPVVAIDYNKERCNLALSLGADYVLSPDEAMSGRVKELTGGHGATVVIEVTGSAQAVVQALEHVSAPRGRVVLLGCSRTPTARLDFYQGVHRPGVEIIGAHNYVRPREESSPGYWTMRDDVCALLNMMTLGRLQVAPLVARMLSPVQAPEVYQRLFAGDSDMMGLVFDWQQMNQDNDASG